MGLCMSTDAAAGAASNVKQQVMGRRQRKREVKRLALEALATERKNDALLTVIPGRMFVNGASDSACIFTQQGRKGTNQDAMVVWEGFASMEDTVFCGVFDGHGPFGHLVARRVRDSLPSKLVAYWQEELAAMEEANGDADDEEDEEEDLRKGVGDSSMHTDYGSNVSTTYESAVSDVEEFLQREPASLPAEPIREPNTHKPPPMFGPWKEAHLTAYKVMDGELRTHPIIDCFCSGTTTVTVLKQGRDLVIGNVGDSRAIMGAQDEDGVWGAVQLTVDLKPNLPQEAERIRECKGRVFALHDEPQVSRVWLPYDNSPGLAMARAFGDFCLKDYGVIAVPEITHRQLTEQDKFIVLATDGIWDVLSNEEAVHIIVTAPTRATAARALVDTAVRVWRLKYPTSKVDDCAVVCLYLDDPQAVHSAATTTTDESSLSADDSYDHKDWKARRAAPPEHDLKPTEGANEGELSLERATTVLSHKWSDTPATEVGEISNGDPPPPTEIERSGSRHQRSLADWLDADEEEEWSALEGVTRVNSLLTLPRFPAGDRRAEGSSRTTV